MLAGGGRAKSDGVNQIINGLGSLLSGNQNGGNGIDLSMISNVIESFSASSGSSEKDHHSHKEKQKSDENNGIDFENVLNIASMFLGQNGNSEGIMGLIPMFLENFANGGSDVSGGKKHDHSDHSWYMPPVLENLHLMWDHFRYKFLYKKINFYENCQKSGYYSSVFFNIINNSFVHSF